MGRPINTETNIQRFVKNITVLDNDCWEWQAARQRQDYGQFRDGDTKKQINAHRWIYEYINGVKLTRNQFVCHTCDNPPCCNPKHLWVGTPKENSNDMFCKKRNAPPTRGELDGMSKLTGQEVIAIRNSSSSGKKLARIYNVAPSTICDIRKRRSWKHI